jgi:hypothetical protein
LLKDGAAIIGFHQHGRTRNTNSREDGSAEKVQSLGQLILRTPLDPFVWGYVKSIVYQSRVTGIDDLSKRITDAIMIMHGDMFLRT